MTYTQDKGIIHEFSAAYTSEQNGFFERNNITVVEATRSKLHSRNLPSTLWAENASTAVFIWNRTVSQQRSDKTPYEQLFQQVPDVFYFRVFGCDAYLHIPKKHRAKLDAKCQKLILVGYDQKGRAYRLWHPRTKRIHVGIDVFIHETLGTPIIDNMPASTEPNLGTIGVPIAQLHPLPAAAILNTYLPTSSDRPSISMHSLSEGSNHIHANHILQNDGDHYETHSPHNYEVDNPATPIQGEIIGAHIQGEFIEPPIQGEFIPGDIIDSSHHTSPSSTSPLTSHADNMNNNANNEGTNRQHDFSNNEGNKSSDDDNTSNTKHLGLRLTPSGRHPPIRYRDWVRYDDNRSNTRYVAYMVSQSERINEPKTYKEAM